MPKFVIALAAALVVGILAIVLIVRPSLSSPPEQTARSQAGDAAAKAASRAMTFTQPTEPKR